MSRWKYLNQIICIRVSYVFRNILLNFHRNISLTVISSGTNDETSQSFRFKHKSFDQMANNNKNSWTGRRTVAYKTAVLFCNHSYRSSNSSINWRKARHHKVFIIDTLKNKTKYGKTLFRSEGKRSVSYLSTFLRPSLSCSDQLHWFQKWSRKILIKFLSIQPHDISHSVSPFWTKLLQIWKFFRLKFSNIIRKS